TPGPLLPATAASKPSWPIPSTPSFCILSPVFHRLEHASDPGSLARRSPHALVDNALLLDHANRRPFAHPNPRHALLLGLDTHRPRGSRRSQSVPLVCATLQTSLPAGYSTLFCRRYSDSVAVCDHGSEYWPVLFGLLPNTPHSDNLPS